MLSISFPTESDAQLKLGSAYFSGQIKSYTRPSRLLINTFRNPIGFIGPRSEILPVNKNGFFKFQISDWSSPLDQVRLQVYDLESGKMIFNNVLVEMGDSIIIDVQIRANLSKDMYSFNKFKGRGYLKYQCAYVLSKISDRELVTSEKNNIDKVPFLMDSLLQVKLITLDEYKDKLMADIYYSLKVDVIAQLKSGAMRRIKSVFESIENDSIFQAHKKVFNQIVEYETIFPDSILCISPFYDRYLENMAIRKMQFMREWKPFTYENYFAFILKNYTGVIRDKLLAFSFLNEGSMFFYDFENTENYSLLLNEASNIIESPNLRDRIVQLSKVRAKGMPAFDFTLPADSTGKLFSLSELRGKVILLDVWGYQCTACYLFANIFHDKVYPLFKDSSNFKVVSVLHNSTFEKYMSRLRRENGPAYTFADYINLFAGKGVEMGRKMEENYKIAGYPFILLIDKNGKILSSRIPFFVETNSSNIDKLICLIKMALKD